MDRFSIAQGVANLLPNMQVVVVAAYNLNNNGTNAQVAEFAEETATATLSSLSAYPNAQSHPRIALYRDTLKEKCNLSAKKFPQSNESLYRRLLKEKKALRPINPIVDFYNAVSIKHGVTAGAFDLGELQTRSAQPLELRMSCAGDSFKALDAEMDAQPTDVATGELVYAQGPMVLTRHLAWRQAAQGLVTEKTQHVIFMSEVLNEQNASGSPELAQRVADDLVDGLHRFFGVEGQVTILGHVGGKLSVGLHSAFF